MPGYRDMKISCCLLAMTDDFSFCSIFWGLIILNINPRFDISLKTSSYDHRT